MVLQSEARVASGHEALDRDVRDLHMVSGAGGTFLYAGTGRNGGLSVYEITASAAPRLVDTAHFATLSNGVAQTQIGQMAFGGSEMLTAGTSSDGRLLAYQLDPDAGFGAPVAVQVPLSKADAWTGTGGGQVYALDSGTGAIQNYQLQGGNMQRVPSDAGSDPLPEGSLLTVVPTDTGTVLVAAGGGSASELVSYHAPSVGGAPTVVDRAGPAEGLGLSDPTAMVSVTAHGASWVIVAAAGSSTLSVLQVAADGFLAPSDHVLDTAATRFGGVQALAVAQADGHVFVFAGGADDGLSVFTMLPNGRLIHLQSIAEAAGRGLDDVTAIEAVRMGDDIRIFVASEGLPGLSRFSWSLDNLGAIRNGNSARGTAGNDVLLASDAGQATLTGGAGDDILVSGSGGAVLTGGAGSDLFVLQPTDAMLRITDFQPGVDRLDLSHFPLLRSPAQLTVTSLPTGVQLDFQASRILITSADGTPLDNADLWGSDRFFWADRLLTNPIPLPQRIVGTGKADRIGGGAGRDTLDGGEGDDTILGAGGADNLDGGVGHDEIWAGSGADVVIGNWGRDTIGGGDGNDWINGGAGADLIWSGSGEDTVSGGEGDDALWAMDGADLIWAGAGDDMLGGGAGNDNLAGGVGDDTLYGGLGDDSLAGAAGADEIWAMDGADLAWGGAGNDVIGGGAGRDTLDGGEGDDTILGAGGADNLDGGVGHDEIWAGSGADVVIGNWGQDTIGGGDGNDWINSGAGADMIWSGSGEDTVSGGEGDDALWAMDGADLIWAGAGDDMLGGGAGHDNLAGGVGDDTLYGGLGDDSLAGAAGADEIWAMDGADLAWGGAGDDELWGGAGRDTLDGGEGDDRLTGGVEDDLLLGSGGRDVFVFGKGHGRDRIRDFEPGQDRIEIAGGSGFSVLSIQQSEDGVEITGPFGTIFLDGLMPDQIGVGDFLFS